MSGFLLKRGFQHVLGQESQRRRRLRVTSTVGFLSRRLLRFASETPE